jgi:hypothetical protein
MRLFQNFSFERATIKKSSFVGRRPKNCKSFGKTNRVLQKARISTRILTGQSYEYFFTLRFNPGLRQA